MSKYLWIALMMMSTQARAVDFVLGGGIDLQISQNDLNGHPTFESPDSEAKIGGAVLAHVDIPVSQWIGLRTGVEVVQRYLKQDYDFWLFGSDDGHTRYDVLSADIPLYVEVYLGGGKHIIYAGPKVAVKIYDHCNQVIDDPNDAFPCQQDGVRDVFIPFQIGYIIKFTDYFGLNVFTEQTLTHVVDKNGFESDVFRGGVTGQFYF